MEQRHTKRDNLLTWEGVGGGAKSYDGETSGPLQYFNTICVQLLPPPVKIYPHQINISCTHPLSYSFSSVVHIISEKRWHLEGTVLWMRWTGWMFNPPFVSCCSSYLSSPSSPSRLADLVVGNWDHQAKESTPLCCPPISCAPVCWSGWPTEIHM